MWCEGLVLAFITLSFVGSQDSEDFNESENEPDDSTERLGPGVTQIFRHPYAASLLYNDTYLCSGVVLNTHWVLTMSKCFEREGTRTYFMKDLGNYSIRVGSSYNNKGGELYKIRNLINNYEIKAVAVKLERAIEFNSRINSVQLPDSEDEPALGYLASMIAWTPNGHMRLVNAPVVDPSICETYTKLLLGQYVCIGGIQDPNRHFCRNDHGGALVQNNTLIGITSFIQKCALYTRPHAFPKISSISRWLDAIIWDEESKPTTTTSTTSTSTSPETPKNTSNSTANTGTSQVDRNPYDPKRFMLTLPFDPINVPLQPAEDNSVMPGISLYESYLRNFAKKTPTTQNPMYKQILEKKMRLMKKYEKSMMKMNNQYNSYNTL